MEKQKMSDWVIYCKEHGELILTAEQYEQFIQLNSKQGGRCPACNSIPKLIKKIVKLAKMTEKEF